MLKLKLGFNDPNLIFSHIRSNVESLWIYKNLCYAFIYADGITLRAWWTLDGILFTCGEDRSYLLCEVLTSEVDLYRVLS